MKSVLRHIYISINIYIQYESQHTSRYLHQFLQKHILLCSLVQSGHKAFSKPLKFMWRLHDVSSCALNKQCHATETRGRLLGGDLLHIFSIMVFLRHIFSVMAFFKTFTTQSTSLECLNTKLTTYIPAITMFHYINSTGKATIIR